MVTVVPILSSAGGVCTHGRREVGHYETVGLYSGSDYELWLDGGRYVCVGVGAADDIVRHRHASLPMFNRTVITLASCWRRGGP